MVPEWIRYLVFITVLDAVQGLSISVS